MAEPDSTIRILIADDHTIFREGLRRLLETETDFQVVGEARDGKETLRLVTELRPDILLLDLAMPRLDGLEALRELVDLLSVRGAPPPRSLRDSLRSRSARAEGSSSLVRTLLLTAAIDNHQMLEAIQLGARGVVLKCTATAILFKAIRAVMAGQYWLGRDAVSDIVEALRKLSASPSAKTRRKGLGLTPREMEIVSAVVAGLPNGEIAQKFSLSEQTVKHHLTSIFDKVGVSCRVELAVFALHHGLVQTGSSVSGSR